MMKTYAVVYDGDCRICGRIVARLKNWDSESELEIAPAQQSGVKERFPWIPERAFAESIQLVRLADGRTWQGAASVEQLLEILPRGEWFGWIFHVPFVRIVAENFYRLFARNRYQLGCGAHCTVDHEHRR